LIFKLPNGSLDCAKNCLDKLLVGDKKLKWQIEK